MLNDNSRPAASGFMRGATVKLHRASGVRLAAPYDGFLDQIASYVPQAFARFAAHQAQVNMSLVLRHSIAALQNGFGPVGQLALRNLLLHLLGQLPERDAQLSGAQHALHVTDDRVDSPPRRRTV